MVESSPLRGAALRGASTRRVGLDGGLGKDHPRLAKAAMWFLVVMVPAELLLAVYCAAEGNWLGATFYAAAVVMLTWAAWSWRALIRGDRQPPTLLSRRA
jgi:hypothetical protein